MSWKLLQSFLQRYYLKNVTTFIIISQKNKRVLNGIPSESQPILKLSIDLDLCKMRFETVFNREGAKNSGGKKAGLLPATSKYR